MSEDRLLKKALVGGFDREDVMVYINELLTELKKSREENERMSCRVSELETKLDEYETREAAASIANYKDDVIDNPVEVLSQVDRILQSYLNNLAQN